MTNYRYPTAVSRAFDSYLLEVADAVNTTLDLNTLLQRVAEMLKRFIDYEIFAILLLNEKTQELRVRFQVGHPPEVAERIRIKVGQGVTGQAVQRREAVLVNDVTAEQNFINSAPGVRSELAVPLIAKNKVIGVLDVEAAQPGAFTEEHKRLLTLFASRIAVGIENARLYTRVSRQARQLTLLTEISRELTSILNVDQLLKRVADLVTRIIDYEMFSILLLDPTGTVLQHRFSLRFKESVHLKHEIPIGQGLVGYAARDRAGCAGSRRLQRPALHHGQPRDALRALRSADLQGQGHRRARHRAHPPRLLQRRPRPHHDHHGGAGRHRHRERHALRAHRAPGKAPRTGPRTGPRTAISSVAAEASRSQARRSRRALFARPPDRRRPLRLPEIQRTRRSSASPSATSAARARPPPFMPGWSAASPARTPSKSRPPPACSKPSTSRSPSAPSMPSTSP